MERPTERLGVSGEDKHGKKRTEDGGPRRGLVSPMLPQLSALGSYSSLEKPTERLGVSDGQLDLAERPAERLGVSEQRPDRPFTASRGKARGEA